MKIYIWAIILLLLSVLQHSSSKYKGFFVDSFLPFRDMIFKLVGKTSVGKPLERARKLNRLQPQVPDYVPFPCDTENFRSPRRPQTVHELRPGDIDVVAAMGDSLTAGNGAAATNLFQVGIENRGLSWSIGGQGTWREFLTLPNILKEFNPNLIGYSLEDSLSHHKEAQFNVAEIGSMGEDMLFMAKVLVKRIKADPRVDFEEDWKHVNIMVGPNDFCLKLCYLNETELEISQETHRVELTAALDYLRDNLPRTLVSLTLTPNLEILQNFKGLPMLCDEIHLFTCPCLFGIAHRKLYPVLVEKQTAWQQVQTEVANDVRYQKKSDFNVVLQPFTRRLIFPQVETENGNVTDRSFLSQDCFHFSQKANARAANALWNNLMEPVGRKSEDWTDTFTKFLCPSKEYPFIFTNGNS